MSKNYLLGFTILFLTACGGSSSVSSGSSSTGPINAAPVISSGNTYSVAENTTAIGSVAASDADGDTLNYVLTGDDSSLVTLTGTTLSFNAAPDFEAPSDANTDNVYKVTLVVSDGLAKDAKDLEISVTNVNEGPQLIVGSSYTVSENTTTVTTATVSDSSSAVAFSLSGTDSAAMTIGESSGVLAFAANPDFEAPSDADADNVYNVTITATDDAGSNSADVTVTVTDVDENSHLITGPSGNPGDPTSNTSITENITTVHTFYADEPIANWTLVGNDDDDKFSIDPNGALVFK